MEIRYFLIVYYAENNSITDYGSLEELNEALHEIGEGAIRVKVISGYLLEDRS